MLEYTIRKWQSPSNPISSKNLRKTGESPENSKTDDFLDKKSQEESNLSDDTHSFGLRPSGGGGGVSIKNDWSIAPEGVFCQRPDIYRKKLPDIPDHFTVKIETADEVIL